MGFLVLKIKSGSHKQFMKKIGAFVRNVHINLLSHLTIKNIVSHTFVYMQ